MADTSPSQKRYTNFVNKEPWVDPSFVRLGPPALLQPGVNASALFGLEYKRDKERSARINQSTVGGNKNNTLTNPNNKANDIGLSGAVNRSDSDIQQGNKSGRETYTALERGVYNLNDRVVAVDRKVESLDEGYRAVPSRIGEVETNMAYKGYQVEELERRNKVHSAKIHELERELRNVRMENNGMTGRIGGPDGGLSNIPEDTYRNGNGDANGYYGGQTQGYEQDIYQDQPPVGQEQPPVEGQGRGRRVYENEQHNIAHRHGGPDGEPYWGFNRYYNPQYMTAYRREHVPYYAKRDEKQEQTQYADDYNHLQEMQRRQEEDWRRKRLEEEEKLMKDKPRTYDYTTPYQNLFPPRDINKYFHDSKYTGGYPEPKPDDYYFAQQPPGGFYIIRFHDSGYDEVNLSLKEQQTIIKSFNGLVFGVARKQNVISIEGDSEWRFSRVQAPRRQINVRHRNVEDALALLWFPSRDKAFDFFSNSFRNRFKQQGFPSPHGWEGHYIPLLTPPFLSRTLDTYLIIEMLNVGKDRLHNIQNFEAEARQEVLQLFPNSLPFIASAMRGRDSLKPGPMFRDRSKVFISRFNSMSEMAELWDRGVIQGLLQKWNLSVPLNVSAFSLQDWKDY